MSNAWGYKWSAFSKVAVYVKADICHCRRVRAATGISGGDGESRSLVLKKLQSSDRPEVLEELMDTDEGVSELSWIIKYDQVSRALV